MCYHNVLRGEERLGADFVKIVVFPGLYNRVLYRTGEWKEVPSTVCGVLRISHRFSRLLLRFSR